MNDLTLIDKIKREQAEINADLELLRQKESERFSADIEAIREHQSQVAAEVLELENKIREAK